jgi:hypothetical protein
LTLKQTIEDLQRDIVASEQRVEAVKSHAEKKLNEYDPSFYDSENCIASNNLCKKRFFNLNL